MVMLLISIELILLRKLFDSEWNIMNTKIK